MYLVNEIIIIHLIWDETINNATWSIRDEKSSDPYYCIVGEQTAHAARKQEHAQLFNNYLTLRYRYNAKVSLE